jgi:hypothetical protein
MVYKLPKPFDEIAVYDGSEHTKEEKKEAALKYYPDYYNEFLNHVADKFEILKSLFKYGVKGRLIIKEIHISQ